MFAHIEVFILVLGQEDLLFVVAQLEIRHVVFLALLNLFALLDLLFSLLLLLLELLRCLLGFSGEIFGADLSAQNRCLRPVAVLDAQRYLVQDEFGLFPPLHRPERLDLKLAENVGRAFDVALRFLDI